MRLRRAGATPVRVVPPPVVTPGAWAIPRGLIVLLAVAAAVVSVAGIKAFANVLGPAFLALMLTVAVHPLQRWARGRGLRPWIGMVIALAAVWSILILLLGALVLSGARLATELPDYTDRVNELLSGVRSRLAEAGIDSTQIHNLLGGLDVNKVVSVLGKALRDLVGVLSNLFFVLAMLMFMAVDAMAMGRKMTAVARMRPEIAYALEAFAVGTRKYLIVSTVFGLIVAVLDGIALWLMGVPLPILWAVLSFITNYIPNIGFVIGLIPPVLLALLDSGPTLMIWVVVIYCVINFVIQSVIQPKYVGDSVGLSVTVTFLSLVFWSWVLGPLGALLAVPLTLLVKALLLDIDPSTRWVSTLIADTASGGDADRSPAPGGPDVSPAGGTSPAE